MLDCRTILTANWMSAFVVRRGRCRMKTAVLDCRTILTANWMSAFVVRWKV